MRALRFTHVAIHADDMAASLAFYVDVLGMRRVPSPDFEQHVEWLQLGDQQLHLFRRETLAPQFHHLGLEVDDFETAYLLARDRGLFDGGVFSPDVRELNDGSVQMYLRVPRATSSRSTGPTSRRSTARSSRRSTGSRTSARRARRPCGRRSSARQPILDSSVLRRAGGRC